MKKLGVIVIVLIAALGLMGVAYAYWTDTLHINSSVSTGNEDVTFHLVATNDIDSPVTLDPSSQGTWALSGSALSWSGGSRSATRNAAYTTVAASSDYRTLTVTMNNAYSGYWGSAGCTIENVGSIPVKVESVSVEGLPSSGLTVLFSGALDASVHTLIAPTIEAGGGIYFQWDDTATPGTLYTVTVRVVVSQWNLVP
jgi:predicted ribosomally synthesized peptide with SipW-like signal peptide